MDGQSPRPQHHRRRPEREGSHNYDIESMDGAGGAPWRQNGSSEALLRYDDGGGGGGPGSVGEPLLRKRTLNTTSQIAIVGANVCPIESLDYEFHSSAIAAAREALMYGVPSIAISLNWKKDETKDNDFKDAAGFQVDKAKHIQSCSKLASCVDK